MPLVNVDEFDWPMSFVIVTSRSQYPSLETERNKRTISANQIKQFYWRQNLNELYDYIDMLICIWVFANFYWVNFGSESIFSTFRS